MVWGPRRLVIKPPWGRKNVPKGIAFRRARRCDCVCHSPPYHRPPAHLGHGAWQEEGGEI